MACGGTGVQAFYDFMRISFYFSHADSFRFLSLVLCISSH
jgi:hypothetical protein